jgi:hypothetical protein
MKQNTFYSDENLMNASPTPAVKSFPHTIDEIASHFPELPIIDIWHNPKMRYLKTASYDSAEMFFNDGRISADHWEGFNAIWRNLTFHYSSVAIEFEF